MNAFEREYATCRLKRAGESLDSVDLLIERERWNDASNRLYYACFYTVEALLSTQGLASKKHSGVRSIFSREFVKTGIIPTDLGKFYQDVFEYRQEIDYREFAEAEASTIRELRDQANNFVEVVTLLVNQRLKEG